jgi:hypothetical protein
MSNDPSRGRASGSNWSRITQWLLWAGLAAAVTWLVFGHGEHLLSVAPLLFVLACPLMHLFGHHGHGSHGDHRRGDEETREGDGAQPPAHRH